MNTPPVSILMGSESDLSVMSKAFETLKEFGVEADMKALSAHRNPEGLDQYVKEAQKKGVKVFICGAGMSAHLAGVVASKTALPVIGVPISGSMLQGLDSLLSTFQMPRGVPVATVAINGAFNAAILAVQILAIHDKKLEEQLKKFKAGLAS